jgi:hypothetical protein
MVRFGDGTAEFAKFNVDLFLGLSAGYFPGQKRDAAICVFQKGFEGFNPVFHQKGIAVSDLIDIPDEPLNFIVKFNQNTVPAGTALQIGKTKQKGKTAQDKAGGGKDHGNGHSFNPNR